MRSSFRPVMESAPERGVVRVRGEFTMLTGFRISNADAVVYAGGNALGAASTAPESGSAVLIFAAMLLFALRTLAQRYCLWREQCARHRLTVPDLN
jgi:hypothetical protein